MQAGQAFPIGYAGMAIEDLFNPGNHNRRYAQAK